MLYLGVRVLGSQTHLHSSEGRADGLSLSGVEQDSDLGLRLSAHRPGSTTCAGNTSLQCRRPADPGWLLLCPFWGGNHTSHHTWGWTPASQSQQEEGPKDKLRGTLSWGHSGSSMAGGRAGGRAGRQFGEGVFGAWQTQGLIAGASPGLTLAPALELQVGMLRQAWAPPLQFSLGHSLPPPTRFQSFGQGGCGASLSLPGHLGGIGSANGTGPVGLGGTATYQTSLLPDLPAPTYLTWIDSPYLCTGASRELV